MDLSSAGDSRRTKRKFPAANDGLGDRDGNASPGSDTAMIEEITGIGFEIVGVKHPTTKRNGHAKLVLFIALPVKRSETAIIGVAEIK